MVYFDNPATTFPKPENVYAFIDHFYREFGVNVGRGLFREASIADKLCRDTREMMLGLLHAPVGYECIFTASATEALNTVIQGFPWKKGMNLYVTTFEHNAVLRAAYHIRDSIGVNVNVLVPGRSDFRYDFDEVRAQFVKAKPDMLIVTHASNVVGFLNPAAELFKLGKEFGALTVCDMAQTAGLVDFDLGAANVDVSVFAGHKTLYGPFGVAGFVSNQKTRFMPLLFGGTGFDSANESMPEESPTKYEAGSHNIMAIAGLHASLEWLNQIGMDAIRAKEKEDTQRLLALLRRYSNIEIQRCPDESQNIGVVSCSFHGYSSDNIGQVLSQQDIAVRTGLHCAPLTHRFLGTFPSGTVRFGVSYFTSDNDFVKLEEALDYIECNS